MKWWAEIWAIFDSSQKAELLPRVVTPRPFVSDLIAGLGRRSVVGKATSFAWSRSVLSEHAYPLTIENQTKAPEWRAMEPAKQR